MEISLPNMAKRILIDADAFVALNNPADSNHKRATIINNYLTSINVSFFTSDPALGEAITIISQKVGHQKAIYFTRDMFEDIIIIIETDANLRKKAFEIFKKQTSKNISFTDCVNMAILEREKLNEIFSFDSDYKKNGVLRIGIDTPLGE